MAFNIKSSLQWIETHLRTRGTIRDVIVGEPKNPPSHDRTFAAVFMDSVAVDVVTLTGTVETHSVVVRVYAPELKRPVAVREREIDNVLAYIERDLLGDFSLGATIRNIDVDNMITELGYLEVGGVNYRIAEVVLPIIVDDSSTLAA